MKAINFSANDTLQKQIVLQNAMAALQTSPACAALKQLQAEINSWPIMQIKQEFTWASQLQPYLDSALNIQRQIGAIYGPLESVTKEITSMTVEWKSVLQASEALQNIPKCDVSGLTQIAETLQKNFANIQLNTFDISEKDFEDYCEEGEITPETVAEAVDTICAEASEKKLTVPDKIDKVKRTNWFFALTIVWMILSFFGKPAIDHMKDDALESWGVTQFWEQSGVYEWLDQLFDIPTESGAVSEEVAKASVGKSEGNSSKAKRDDLIAKISAIRAYISAAPQDENTGNLQVYLSDLEKELGTKKYGLVFEEHREAIDEVLETHTPVLTEDGNRFLNHGGEMNFLLEGDNLAALKLLEKTHTGKIDLIYIDPPYNRGKTDFIYDDNYIAKEDTFKHSKWASFMSARLKLAKELLTDQGLLFLSIDDNEVASIKLLCDQIFGGENFINLFVWQRNSSAKTEVGKFTVNTEYVLLYAKTHGYKLNPAYKPLSEASQKLFKFDDGDGRGKYQTVSLQKPRDPGPETTYDYVDNTGKVWPCPPKGWRMKFEKIKALENDGRLVLSGKTLRVKDYWNERENDGKRIDTLWNDLPQNTAGSAELESIMGQANTFENPKPVELIKRCLKIGCKDACILDFFAGSGTTGHAVMKLNTEDGGHRKFILCTNNENGICEKVTYERLKRVMERDGYEASLKYYKIDYVPISEKLYYEYADELLRHVRELVELENGINFTGNAEIAIVLTDKELADFIAYPEAFAQCRTLYLGHNILPNSEQAERLREREIQIRVIPDYYYRELEG